MYNEPESVPCKWCGKQTDLIYTRECHLCWNIRHSIECSTMDVVEKIYNHVKKERE
jgi:hypothetical protein